MALGTQQARFVEEYLIDPNGAQAAIRAGYGPRSANEQACRLLTNENVRTLIQQKLAEAAETLGVRREGVVLGLLEAVAIARKKGDPRTVERAAAELNKMMGFYRKEEARVPRR